jgi:hypothetical protein
MTNSRAKGARNELGASAALANLGMQGVRRAVQYSGRTGQADLVAPGRCHIEVKSRESIACMKWMDRAVEEASMTDAHIVLLMMREDRGEWCYMVRQEDALRFARWLLTYTQDHHAAIEIRPNIQGP